MELTAACNCKQITIISKGIYNITHIMLTKRHGEYGRDIVMSILRVVVDTIRNFSATDKDAC